MIPSSSVRDEEEMGPSSYAMSWTPLALSISCDIMRSILLNGAVSKSRSGHHKPVDEREYCGKVGHEKEPSLKAFGSDGVRPQPGQAHQEDPVAGLLH